MDGIIDSCCLWEGFFLCSAVFVPHIFIEVFFMWSTADLGPLTVVWAGCSGNNDHKRELMKHPRSSSDFQSSTFVFLFLTWYCSFYAHLVCVFNVFLFCCMLLLSVWLYVNLYWLRHSSVAWLWLQRMATRGNWCSTIVLVVLADLFQVLIAWSKPASFCLFFLL